MSFKKQIVQNFDKILSTIKFAPSSVSEDTIASLNVLQLFSILGVKDFTRQDVLDICNDWDELTKVLPEKFGKKIYDKLASEGFVNAEKLGYNNIYIVLSSNINMFNYEKCEFRMTHVFGGHLGTDIPMYCQKVFGAVINANVYDAYFETREDVSDFLGRIEFVGRKNDDTVDIRGVMTYTEFKKDYPSATELDFDGLAGAVYDACTEFFTDSELIDELGGCEYADEYSSVECIDAKYGTHKGDKALIVYASINIG